MDNSLSVALVLSAVNNMGSTLSSATRQVRDVQESVNNLSSSTSSGKWSTKYFDDQIAKMQELKDKSEELKSSGTKQITTGIVELAPVEAAVSTAAEFERVMKQVELANYDASVPLKIQNQQMKKLSDLALKLGADTVFSNTDAARAQLNLIKNGMEYKDVLEGGAKAAVYLAQTAEISTDSAADAVSQVTNMFQLQGNQLMRTADDINRAANASSAGVENIMSDLQQAGSTAHTLGLNIKDTTLLLGTLHNMGLGDSSGTFLNDLLLRLDAVSPEAEKALYGLGLLKGATVKKTKAGKIKIEGGKSSIFNSKGQIQDAQQLVNKLRQTLYSAHINPKQMFDSSGNMLPDEQLKKMFGGKKANEVLSQMKKAFGIQGMRAAIAITISGKGSFEEMTEKAKRAKAIEAQVNEMQQTFSGIVESIKGSIETLVTSASTPFMKSLKGVGNSILDNINKLTAWTTAHPKVATSILQLITGLALFNISIGASKLLFGNLLGVFSNSGIAILKTAKYFKGFRESYVFLTSAMGGGKIASFFRSFTFGTKLDGITRGIMSFGSKIGGAFKFIGSGAVNIVKSVGNVGLEFLKTGGRAIIAGAQMAGAWLKAAGTSALNAIKVIGSAGLEFLKAGGRAIIAGAQMASVWLKAAGASALNAIKVIGSAGLEFLKTGGRAIIAGAQMAGIWLKAAGASALNAIKVIGSVGLEFLKTGGKAIIAGAQMAGIWLKTAGASALSAIKTVASVGAQYLVAGAKALIAGGQMALAWVIGLGPIGWIIAGVTAIVAAAVIAWKTNFLGFRDKAKEIFSVVGNFIGGIVNGIKNVWSSAIGWIGDKLGILWDYAKKVVDNPIVKGIVGGAKFVGGKIGSLFNGKSEQTIKKSTNSNYSDNKNITYNIHTTDPRLAASQISRNNDKYVKSRDPKLGYSW